MRYIRKMSLWTPDFVIAIVLIVGAFFLIFSGIDGEVKSILLIAAGWAFGSGYQTRKQNDKGGSK